MVSARITCPDCKSVLKPSKPVADGKKIICPKCGSTFLTPGLVEEQPPPLKTSPAKKPAKAAVKKAAGPTRSKKHHDDEENDDPIYSFTEEKKDEDKPDIEYAPDMSIKDLRGPAQEMVVKPSNLIMLICGLSALSNIFLICWSFWPMVFSESVVDWEKLLAKNAADDKTASSRVTAYKEYKDIKDEDLEIVHEANEKAVKGFLQDGFPPLGRLWMMGLFILVLIYNAVTIVGAVSMQNLESRRWGIASSIMMFLPMGAGGLSCLCVLGLYFLEQMTGFLGELTRFYSIVAAVGMYLLSIYIGVISLQVLLSQKVIDGYEYVAE